MGAEEMQAIEQEIADIHVQMAVLHERLAVAAKRRDLLKLATKQAARAGGIVISVPAAKVNLSAKV